MRRNEVLMSTLKVLVAAAAVAGGLAIPATAANAQGPVNFSCGPALRPTQSMPKSQWQRMTSVGGRRGAAHLYTVGDAYKYRDVWWVWGSGLRGGDKVSLDWSDRRGVYHACHATVKPGNDSVTSFGVDDPGGRSFRACIKNVGGSWRCTGWWHTKSS
ncbi:hypothetical protein ACIBHX_35960 [Nonomuraea sp. NPDC050536]|uniref:hypothetical protein n=1 Tax=Nonomuraea sp. NPDC050536 TaxID=3364366 RepID=UPI0037CA1824